MANYNATILTSETDTSGDFDRDFPNVKLTGQLYPRTNKA